MHLCEAALTPPPAMQQQCTSLQGEEEQKQTPPHSHVYEVAVVGFGPVGAMAVALQTTLHPSRIVVVDPSFCGGGDLGVAWGAVPSNTTAAQVATALQRVPRWAGAPLKRLSAAAPSDSVPLAEVAEDVRDLSLPLLKLVTAVCGSVQEVRATSTSAETYALRVADPATGIHRVLYARRVLLCSGAVPRALDLPLRAIPLEVALDPARLPRFVRREDRVVVFGLAHSGCLVLDNLRACGAHVTGVFRGAAPFVLARSGHYDGVKGRAEGVVDEITAGAWGTDTPMLVRNDDTARVLRAVLAAQAVVYCTGLRPRAPALVGPGGEALDPACYNAATGRLCGHGGGLFGFGAGWPSQTLTPDGVRHFDVGIPSFVDHLLRTLPGSPSS